MSDASGSPASERPLRLAFFGSGPFAIPPLRRLLELCASRSQAFECPVIVSRPGQPRGRGRKVRPMPLEVVARELGRDVRTPQTVNSDDFLDELRALRPHLFIVADYGEFLRKPFRELPSIGAYNLHASLLPLYRGAAPVAHAILRGEVETGVTFFRIVRTMDGGPIVGSSKLAIGDDETAGELEERLADLAADLLVTSLERFESADVVETPQDDSAATLAPKLTREQAIVDWERSGFEVTRQINALVPWPVARAPLASRARGGPLGELRFLRAKPATLVAGSEDGLAPGTVLDASRDAVTVACERGAVDLLRLQRPGKAALDAAAFCRGFAFARGDVFA